MAGQSSTQIANRWFLPIAPHNLNARPLVISEDDVVELSVSSREDANLLSLDSRIHTIPTGHPIRIQKAFPLQLARLHDDSYFKTLRNKLHWGRTNAIEQ